MKLYKVSLTSLILLFFLCISPYQLKAAKPTLEFLNIKYSEYQSKSDYQGMARVLKKMIDLGYKSVERYKQLGDLYFYIKMDEEALDVFREQAKWANTVETWVNLSNLLIWKQKNKEGINALEKAYQLAPDDDKLTEKLAGVYEFQKMIKQAEQVWLELYNQKGKSVQAGRQVVEFYLRNSMVLQAREVMDELYKKDTDLAGSAELKILDMKINAWTSRPEDAFKAMQRLDIKTIPEKDLDYSFKLALYGGDLIFAEKVLLRFKEIGKDVWNQELELSFIKGNPSETRELIEERIDDKGKNIELVKALYETYRAERKIEGEIDSLEELLQLDYKNSKWHELAMKYYIYYQKHDRGIDVFEDIVDDHEDAQLAVINLCRLYLAGQKYENFEEMIALVTDKSMVPLARELRFQEAYLVDDREKIFNATLDILKYIPNISPEEMVEKLKQEQHPNSEPDESLPNDRYLELTTNLSDLANELGWVKETAEYGRTAYLILKSRYAKYPTKDRLRQLIYWGTDFGSVEERTTDFVEGNKHFSDTEFYLQYYRFLMNQDKFELADAMLKKLFASPTNMEESYQAVEHTFGFVSYNLSKKLFQNIITQDPNYSMGLKRLGQIAHYTDNYLEAAFYLEKYLKVNSFDPEAIFTYGEALHFLHRPFDAEKEFNKVIELLDFPGRNNYDTLLVALCYLRMGDNTKALELLNEAREKDPKNLSIKLNILETLVSLKKWQEGLDLINSEKLDDEKRIRQAKEVVFKSNLQNVLLNEDSEIKSKLKYQQLKAIVDMQLSLRVKINLHLCLQGLGRNIEDRVLLNQLAEKYPVDVEVLSALGYFYTDRGDDSRGMVYLKRAKSIPPSDPILNQSYRELSHKYSPTIFMDYLFSEKNDSDAGKEYTLEISKISGQSMVSEMDKIGYEIKYFKSNLYELETTNKEIVHDLSSDDITESEVPSVSKSDSVSKSAIDIAYFGNIAHNYDLSLIQKYEGHLYFQDKFGFKVVYSAALVSPSLTLTLSGFASMPDHEEFELVKAEAYTTGFEIEGNIFLKDLKQNYTFSYLNRTFDLYNQDYTGQPDQNRISLGVTQGLMTYPNGLNLSVNYTIYNAAGEIEQFDTATSTIVYKHLILPSVQLQVEMTFQHYWTEFFDTTISLYNYSSTTGDFTTEHKSSLSQELSSQKLRMLFSLKKDSWVISGLISYLQETQEEKREIAYTTDTETETIVGSRSSTVSEIGLSAQLFF